MRKLNLILIVLALLCVVFCAVSCKKNNPGDTAEETESSVPTDEKLTVIFEYRDGSDPVVFRLDAGETVSEPEAPSRPGYSFGGWFEDEALSVAASFGAVRADVTYYAAWVSHTACLVRFDSCGGSAVASAVTEKGTAVTAPADPTREGYDFAGWYTDVACTAAFSFSTELSENLTLYAGWKVAEGYAEVSGYLDGSLAATAVVKKGETVKPLSPDGEYSYLWYTDSAMTAPYDFSAAVNESVRLYGIAYSAGLEIRDGTVISYTGGAKHVIVPAKWDGETVTAIGDSAFKGNLTVQTVRLPEEIGSVGVSAFADCAKLAKINLTAACRTVGAYAFSGCGRLAEVGSFESLTAIGEGTFLGCASLTEVDLSAAVTTVGAYAFSGCQSLRTVALGDRITAIGEYAFSDCAALTEFHLPAKLESFGNGVLIGCAPTLTVTGGNDTYHTIGGSLYCRTGRNAEKLLKYLPGSPDETTLSLPSGVTAIGANAFYGNTNLTTVNLAGYSLEAGSLAGLRGVRDLTIDSLPAAHPYLAYYFGAANGSANGATGIFVPSTLERVVFRTEPTALADYAFYGCTGLKTVEGISKIRSIGAYAFAYTALETLKLPAGVTAIGEGAFSRCEKLSAFETEAGNPSYSVYDGCLYSKSYAELLIVPRQKETIEFHTGVRKIAAGAFFKSCVGNVVVPDSVTEIAASAFANADSLETLTVPFIGGSATENTYMLYIFGGTIIETETDGETEYRVSNSGAGPASLRKLTVTGAVTAIPDFAFAYLENVEEFVLTGDVESIGMYGFYGTGVKDVVIPSTVKKVGNYAFASMDALESVTVSGSVGAGLGTAAFYGNRNLKVLRFEEGVTVIPDAVCYPYSSYDRTTGNTTYSSALEELYLPSTLEKIGDLAFAYAGTVTSGANSTRFTDLKFVMTPGNALTGIGKNAFYMSAIKTMNLPASLQTLGELCFANCRRLTSVTFGNKTEGSALAQIGGACFTGCTALNRVTIYRNVTNAADVPTLVQYQPSEDQVSYNVFEGIEVPAIYVYGASFYRQAPYWDSYDKQIYEIND